MNNLCSLKVPAPLDPGFQPAVLFDRHYVAAAKKSRNASPLIIGLEREGCLFSRFETVVNTNANPATLHYVERLMKFLLWARGGWKIYFGGPKQIGDAMRRVFSANGERKFDVELMSRIYERSFEFVLTDAKSVPAAKEMDVTFGGHRDGCYIGFDLGASDYKIAAVKNGKMVYSDEFQWNPKDQPDPQYHYDHLNAGLKKAAAHLPRVDAIGGSSAGVIVNNKIMVASLFRAVPPTQFDKAKNLFLRIRDEWKVPVAVANDGDVTALAGTMSLNTNGMLGIALGSSQAAGYINPQGCVTGWLNELAFAPVDYASKAADDEWSGDRGGGALYFSQQAVNKLLPAGGINLPDQMGLPRRLMEVQSLMVKGDSRAAKIYETIGVYLGYTIPHYADFYEFRHILILGRVTTGKGGDIVLAKAREVMETEFPELAAKIKLHIPDEKGRRVGQAMAAASLPMLQK